MAYTNGSGAAKSSADIEREVEEQRNRVEARIGEIKERLSPGQLLDEVLSYTKDGGSKFAGNLGQQVVANPLPSALLGVSLAWLITSNMSGRSMGSQQHAAPDYSDTTDYPYANIKSGGLKRVSHKADEAGQWWSEFQTDTGSRFKAQSDELGRRAGHFTDEAGRTFSGFIDDTGNRVKQFQDEAGNTLADVGNWASHGWHDMRHGIGSAMHRAGQGAGQMGAGMVSGVRHLGSGMQGQTDMLARQMGELFETQPLIAGALAFAAGAALGAALPHTAQEDALVGNAADQVRRKAGKAAGKMYREGKQQAAEIYDEASAEAGQIYQETRDRVSDLASSGNGHASMSKH